MATNCHRITSIALSYAYSLSRVSWTSEKCQNQLLSVHTYSPFVVVLRGMILDCVHLQSITKMNTPFTISLRSHILIYEWLIITRQLQINKPQNLIVNYYVDMYIFINHVSHFYQNETNIIINYKLKHMFICICHII